MSTYSVGHSDREGRFGWKVFAVFAGFLIPFVIAIGAWLAVSAHNASNQARSAAASAQSAATSSVSGVSNPSSVSHSFASVMLGEVGLLNVGNVPGTMSH